ncbi:MAG: hypothetical protein Q7J80_15445, partial [Anaerolineales bacterium]|nr:hypothetical protein [Anaerolineales bacterium]
GRLEKLAALQKMQADNLHHYDTHCPRCRRANSISRQKLEIFTPGWQEGLKTLEQEAAQREKEMAATAESFSASSPVPSSEPVVPFAKPVAEKVTAAVEKKPAPAKMVEKTVLVAKPKAGSKSKPVTAGKKPATKKPAAVKKPVVKKPAAKKPATKKSATKTKAKK